MEEHARPGYWFYRILGFIDNLIAFFFLFATLINFAAMGVNPTLLLPLFIAISLLIYTNLAGIFARQVLVQGKTMKASLKDWIKVNGIVTLIYSIVLLMAMGTVLASQSLIGQLSKTIDYPVNMIRGVAVFMVVCSVLLLVHVLQTLKYLKRFGASFQDPEQSDASFPEE